MISWKDFYILFFFDNPTLQIHILVYSVDSLFRGTFLIALYTLMINNRYGHPCLVYHMAKDIRGIFYLMKVLIIVKGIFV